MRSPLAFLVLQWVFFSPPAVAEYLDIDPSKAVPFGMSIDTKKTIRVGTITLYPSSTITISGPFTPTAVSTISTSLNKGASTSGEAGSIWIGVNTVTEYDINRPVIRTYTDVLAMPTVAAAPTGAENKAAAKPGEMNAEEMAVAKPGDNVDYEKRGLYMTPVMWQAFEAAFPVLTAVTEPEIFLFLIAGAVVYRFQAEVIAKFAKLLKFVDKSKSAILSIAASSGSSSNDDEDDDDNKCPIPRPSCDNPTCKGDRATSLCTITPIKDCPCEFTECTRKDVPACEQCGTDSFQHGFCNDDHCRCCPTEKPPSCDDKACGGSDEDNMCLGPSGPVRDAGTYRGCYCEDDDTEGEILCHDYETVTTSPEDMMAFQNLVQYQYPTLYKGEIDQSDNKISNENGALVDCYAYDSDHEFLYMNESSATTAINSFCRIGQDRAIRIWGGSDGGYTQTVPNINGSQSNSSIVIEATRYELDDCDNSSEGNYLEVDACVKGLTAALDYCDVGISEKRGGRYVSNCIQWRIDVSDEEAPALSVNPVPRDEDSWDFYVEFYAEKDCNGLPQNRTTNGITKTRFGNIHGQSDGPKAGDCQATEQSAESVRLTTDGNWVLHAYVTDNCQFGGSPDHVSTDALLVSTEPTSDCYNKDDGNGWQSWDVINYKDY